MVAKLLEHFDKGIFEMLGGVVSGHTLKHLAAAVGVAYMVSYVKAGNTNSGPRTRVIDTPRVKQYLHF